MQGLKLADKKPLYLGIVFIVIGVVAKGLIETTLTSDAHIESPRYLAIIYGVQVLAIAAGLFLVIKRPAIRLPGRTEIILLTFSILLSFGFLEIGARLWLNYLATPDQYDRFVLFTDIAAQDFAWTPHPYLSYSPTPEYSKGLTFHNALGYRNDEFPLEKPTGIYRIVVLGGSSTYDVRIEDNHQTFAAQLEKVLKEEYGYQQVEVINAGVPGYNSWEILTNLEFRVLDLDPDLVIIYENTNDVHTRLVEPSSYRGDNSGRRQIWQSPPVPFWEQSTLLRILSRSMNVTRQISVDDFVSSPTYLSWPYEDRLTGGEAEAEELLKENPPIYFQRNLENMIAVAEAHQVKIMLSTWASSPNLNDYAAEDYYQQAYRENNQVVIDVATSRDVPLFDFAAVMSPDAKYWADGRHSNEAGALVKATLFAEFINKEGLVEKSAASIPNNRNVLEKAR